MYSCGVELEGFDPNMQEHSTIFVTIKQNKYLVGGARWTAEAFWIYRSQFIPAFCAFLMVPWDYNVIEIYDYKHFSQNC